MSVDELMGWLERERVAAVTAESTGRKSRLTPPKRLSDRGARYSKPPCYLGAAQPRLGLHCGLVFLPAQRLCRLRGWTSTTWSLDPQIQA